MNLLALFSTLVSAKIYFSEEFDKDWERRWVQSSWKSDGSQAKFIRSPGKWYADAERDAGLKTNEDYRFYAISTSFNEFSNKNKDLVLQFTIKHEQYLDCGGGYIKLLKSGFDQTQFGGDTPYYIMFGPDICGNERKTHFIINYNNDNHLSNKKLRVEVDSFTHEYTAVIKPDNTYYVYIDGTEVSSGSIEDNWDVLAPKEIPDPNAQKPEDWEDNPTIQDPDDKKPDDWDSQPEFVADPEARRPDDWNDEEDGEWTAPMIPNKEFKGEWKPKMIPNPKYKGAWVHPKVPNPDYKSDENLYLMDKIGGVGIEIWQVTSGTVFDNIFVGDDLDEAKAFSDRTFKPRKEGEKEAKEVYDQEMNRLREEAMEQMGEESEDDFEPDSPKIEL